VPYELDGARPGFVEPAPTPQNMTYGLAPSMWRDAHHYRSVLAGGRLALTWELLRRHPEYRLSATSNVFAAGSVSVSELACLTKWGLHFPL